ncbi:uncharacterized protein [Paramormyrops kingsleyae]|uniref:uncharacterized protein n=1 Tax=Paramormyrops kingsleyae TaxID=1676925 RepID=UPI003B96A47F
MAAVTIKEEPLEIDVKQAARLHVDGETQTCCGIKQEGTRPMESGTQQSEEETSLNSASESEDEAAEDDLGEMAVVTIKEEMLESESEDSESEADHQLSCDSDDSFQSDVITEAVETSETERHSSVVKMTLDGAQHVYQGNRLKKMQFKGPQSDKILCGKNVHKRNELTERLYICSDCGKDFFGETELKSHQKSHRLGSTKRDTDPFALKAASNYQVTSQEVKLPFRCSHCDKGFARKGQLNRHEFIHSGQKPFSCSDCGKCFGNKWQLSAHQKIHTGEKPYSCTFCEKCFIRKGELTVHLKRHTGDKPFNCSFCGKGFTTKGEVNIHQRRHVGEKTIGLSHPSSLAAKAQFS